MANPKADVDSKASGTDLEMSSIDRELQIPKISWHAKYLDSVVLTVLIIK